MSANRIGQKMFVVGDYCAGGIVGATTAAAVRLTVSPGTDMVLAMLIGMGVGMIVHVAAALLLSPLLGAFHAMVPASLIGMYGGMFFAMRDTMQQHTGTTSHAIWVGLLFGVIVTAGVHFYDRALRSPAPVDS